MTWESREMRRIGVIGLGYVGVTLAAAMARQGFDVHGVDVQPAVLESLGRGKPQVFEPGVEDVFTAHIGKNLFVGPDLPEDIDAAIISVSTPVTRARRPDLGTSPPRADVAERCSPDTWSWSAAPSRSARAVTSYSHRWSRPGDRALLVMAPERTIQGQALRELVELPQVVGGLDAESLDRGVRLFNGLCRQVVPVSTLETAELVKLTNNCHTDVLYAFGNEIAMLDRAPRPRSARGDQGGNLDYPRPDIAKPGYVGGGCLSKDPYIMLSAAGRSGHVPRLVAAARTLNESLPVHVAHRVADLMRQVGGSSRSPSSVGHYKGWPPTDDTRGTPIADMMPVFEAAGMRVLGHDPVVRDAVIHAYGGQPVNLDMGSAPRTPYW